MDPRNTADDPNRIRDEGNPTSTAELVEIIQLSNILGRQTKVGKPCDDYGSGWGPKGADYSTIIIVIVIHNGRNE